MDRIAAQKLQHELGRKEIFLWAGQPRPGVAFSRADFFMVPFSLLWGGFAFFWEYSVYKAGAPVFFLLWGIPFVAIGLYVIVGRFFGDAFRRRHLYYGVSNERLLILSEVVGHKLTSVSLVTLAAMTLTQGRDGAGTITFGPTSPLAWFFWSAAWPAAARQASPSFEYIANVKVVHDLIQEALRSHK